MPENDRALAALEVLLDEEFEAARKADFVALGAMTGPKEALLAALTAGPAPAPAELSRLRDTARRNAAALQATRQGLKAAHRRIAELLGAANPKTYEADGRRNEGDAPALRLERRA